MDQYTNNKIKTLKDFSQLPSFFDKVKQIKRFTSKQEKEALLLPDDSTIFDYANILLNVQPDNELEALALIFKACEISVSDSYEVIHTCPNESCKYINYFSVDIDEFFGKENEIYHTVNINSKEIILPKTLIENIEDVLDEDLLENLILRDIKKIQKELNAQNIEIFKQSITRKCVKCKQSFEVFLTPNQIISKSGIKNIYKEYAQLSFFSHNSITDIDSLYPFERELYMKLIDDLVNKSNPLANMK